MDSDNELISKCLDCLIDKFGYIETVRFISQIRNQPSEPADFRKELYKGMTLDEMLEAAAEYERENPPKFKNAVII